MLTYFAHPLATVAERDVLLFQLLNPTPADRVLEIGTGSGSTIFRLAREVASVHGVDIAAGAIERLVPFASRARRRAQPIELFVRDFCDPATGARLTHRYDLIVSCDTLEHVASPARFLQNVHAALARGGRTFITFPNEHPSHAHGITWFATPDDLDRLLRNAGFTDISIETVRLSPGAAAVLSWGWKYPRRILKRVYQRLRGHSAAAPQTFVETDFFAAAPRLEAVAPLVNAYSWAVMRLMHLCSHPYLVETAPSVLWDTRVLIRARRGEHD